MLQSSGSDSSKQKTSAKLALKQKRKNDAHELAQLVYDMYIKDRTSLLPDGKIVVKKV